MQMNPGLTLAGLTCLNQGTIDLSRSAGSYTISNLTATSGSTIYLSNSGTVGNRLVLDQLSGETVFMMNTNINHGQADSIQVTGTASGSHQLIINNYGGIPQNRQAVKVVDLPENASGTAVFQGGSDYGAYRYGLTLGVNVPSGYSGVDSAGDYYFYNTFKPSAASGVALSAKMAIAVLGYAEMDEIRKRLGDLRLGSQVDDDVWVRSYTAKFVAEPKGGEPFEQQVRGLEVGKGNLSTFNGGKKFFGFLAGTARADNSFATTGTGETDSKYLGVYGSWLRDDGAYFNLIGINSRYDSSFTTGSDSAKNLNNTGLGLSAEIGKRFERDGGAFIEPQAGLAAMWFSKDNYVTSSGLAVESPAARSLLLRLGLTVGRRSQLSNGTGRQLYGKLNWVHEYAYEGRMLVNQAVFEPSLKGSQWVAGVGFEQSTGRNQVYINLEKAWGSTVSKSWSAAIGSRWNF